MNSLNIKCVKTAGFLAALTVAFSANAAPDYGFRSSTKATSTDDIMLTPNDMDTVLLEGILSAGHKLSKSKKTNPAVVFESHTSYSPGTGNLRILSGSVALLEETTLHGKPYLVRSCQWSYQTWSAGQSEHNNVVLLLDDVRKLGINFANKCMK